MTSLYRRGLKPLLLALFFLTMVAGLPAELMSPSLEARGGTASPPTPKVSNDPKINQQDWYGIVQWTTIGDSYATGVGVGNSLAWNRCVRFSDAYPLLMNKDDRMPGGDPDRKLWNCACSGATSQDILDWQFLDNPILWPNFPYGPREIYGRPQITTLTAGGDDIEFLNLIWYCILQLSHSNPCQDQIKSSTNILHSDHWKENLDKVIKTAVDKGSKAAGDGFVLFVTGYAQVFNAHTTLCNDASFSYWTKPGGRDTQNLTQELRTQLNKLTTDLNTRIQSVVAANPGVVFVNYDAAFEGHRFCEEGVIEPDNQNPNIWFFHTGTIGNGRTNAFDDLLAAKLDPTGNADHFRASLPNRNPSDFSKASLNPLSGLQPNDSNAVIDTIMSLGNEDDITIQSGMIRIFHPTRAGLDTIVTEVFKKFPDWPKPSPWASVSTNVPILSNPATIPSPHCIPAAFGGFDPDKASAAIADFCGQTATIQPGAAPISKTYDGGQGPRDRFTIRFTLSWYEKAGNCPPVQSPNQNGGRECNTVFQDIIGCDPDPSTQNGGSVEWQCGLYYLGFDSGYPDVVPARPG